MNTKLACVLTGALLMSIGSLALAKTWYVEAWGEDVPECGSKTEPCALISWVVENLADKNDKIIVGPGIYSDNIDIKEYGNGVLEGLTLESTAGRYGTIIVPEDPSFPIITIAQAKVRVGKKGKGFTLRGSDDRGILVDDPGFPSLKIEGNQATQNGVGFSLQGDKIQVRYNIARSNVDEGIECDECTSANIQFNEVVGNGSSGLSIVGDVTKALVRNNKTVGNFDGIYVSTDSGTEKVTVKDNVMENNKGAGLYSRNLAGGTIQSNIVTRYIGVGNSDYEYGMEVFQDDGSKVRNNVVLGSETIGVYLNSSIATRFEGNSIVQSILQGLRAIGSDFELFKNNNTYLNWVSASNCGIDMDIEDFVYTRHFFGGGDVVCLEGFGSVNIDDSSTVDKPNAVKVNKARAL